MVFERFPFSINIDLVKDHILKMEGRLIYIFVGTDRLRVSKMY